MNFICNGCFYFDYQSHVCELGKPAFSNEGEDCDWFLFFGDDADDYYWEDE